MTRDPNAQKWENALLQSVHAESELKSIRNQGQVAHSKADYVLLKFVEKIGFKRLAEMWRDLSEERGFTYTEAE